MATPKGPAVTSETCGNLPPPQKTTYRCHHPYPTTSTISSQSLTSTFRLLKFPNTPTAWLDQQDCGSMHNVTLKKLVGDDWDKIIISVESEKEDARVKKMEAEKAKLAKGKSGAKTRKLLERKQVKLYEEKVAGRWLEGLFTHLDWRVHWNSQIPKETMKNLRPYFISPKYRPDIWLDINIEGFWYPLLMIEVVSNEDINLTVGECERSLIHQLRLYRNYCLEVFEVSGFVIPTSTTQCACLKVTVKWKREQLRFTSCLKIIVKLESEMEKVGRQHEAIIRAFHAQRDDFQGFFLPIDAHHHFGEGAFQIPAGQSVVVVTDKMVYKMIIDPTLMRSYEDKITIHYEKLKDLDCISLPTQPNRIKKGNFLTFDRLTYPLNRELAARCLKDFLLKVHTALEKLHNCGFGHYDVRLENICFAYDDNLSDYKVVLIDLDILGEIGDPPYGLASESRMSYLPGEAGLLDWSQLGLMAAFIMSHPTIVKHEDYHDQGFQYPQLIQNLPFIKKLMNEGVFDHSLLHKDIHTTEFLIDVIRSRGLPVVTPDVTSSALNTFSSELMLDLP